MVSAYVVFNGFIDFYERADGACKQLYHKPPKTRYLLPQFAIACSPNHLNTLGLILIHFYKATME